MKRTVAFLLVVTILLLCTSCGLLKDETKEVKKAARNKLEPHYSTVTVESVSSTTNGYSVTCSVSQSGKFFDVSARAELEFTNKKGSWTLVGDPVYTDRVFDFHDASDKYYYYGHRNTSELFQIVGMTETTVTVRHYGHDLTTSDVFYAGGTDVYYNSTDTWELEYIEGDNCFLFNYYDVGLPLLIYTNHLEIEDELSAIYYSGGYRYKELSPENPERYSWFEAAKNAPSD